MDALLTPEQVADRVRLAPHTIYAWLREGRLPGIKLGRRWRVKPEDLDAYVEAARQTPERPLHDEEEVDLLALGAYAEELMRDVPQEEWDRLPSDLCENLDRYLYGHPRRQTAA